MQTASLIHFHSSPIHGTGGFASVAIPPGARLIEYVGRKIDKAESLRQCELGNYCIFSISEAFDLDGNVDWNPARQLNHSCSPNAEARREDGQIWLIALRDISAGEEITFNYNYDLQDFREHRCHCGAAHCVGYIVAEEFFDSLRAAAVAGRENN